MPRFITTLQLLERKKKERKKERRGLIFCSVLEKLPREAQ